jgi:hypothetical protein
MGGDHRPGAREACRGRIADTLIAHLAGLIGSQVKVTLEVEAEVASGVPDTVVRSVTENSRTLKFVSQGSRPSRE